MEESNVDLIETPLLDKEKIEKEKDMIENKIEILKTPTGFLNVRNINDVNGKKIGKVLPGEQYVFQEENSGWYNIILSDNSSGWVNSEYVKVIESEIVDNDQ